MAKSMGRNSSKDRIYLRWENKFHFVFFINLFYYLVLAALGVHCCIWAFSTYSIQASHFGNPKGNQPSIFIRRTDVEAKAPILWPPAAKRWLIGKDLDTGKVWVQEMKEASEDEMAGWHQWLNGHEFEQAPGVGDGQGSLVCCSSLGLQEVGHDLAIDQQQEMLVELTMAQLFMLLVGGYS